MRDAPTAVSDAQGEPAPSTGLDGDVVRDGDGGDGRPGRVPGWPTLPSDALVILADRCAALGDTGAGLLRDAGRATGARLFGLLGSEAADAAPGTFWDRVARLLEDLGFGRVEFRVVDPGLGALRWDGLPEAGRSGDGSTGTRRATAGCHLATGLLAGLIGRAADRPAAVLEVGCRAAADDSCWFLVGSEARLARIHERLLEGEPPARAVGAD